MHNWFECKISYDKRGKTMEDVPQKVVESYLVDALSFTEAEARIIEMQQPYISGNFTVSDIRRARYQDSLLDNPGDRFYKVKINLITLDEKTGDEKKTPNMVLVRASTIHDAIRFLDEGYKSVQFDYVIVAATETALIDIYPYTAEDKTVRNISE